MDPAFQSVDVVKEQWNNVLNFLHTPRTQGKAPGVDDPADWTDSINTLVQGRPARPCGRGGPTTTTATSPPNRQVSSEGSEGTE